MRQPRPWYRTSRGAWYVQIGTDQIRLAKGPKAETEKAAFDAFYKLMAADPTKVPRSEVILVCQVCELFLVHMNPYKNPEPERPSEWRKKQKAAGAEEPKDQELRKEPPCDVRTYWWYRDYLQDFCEQYGKLPAADLKPFHVTRWLDAHKGWTAARRHATTAVKRAFNWATEQGVIDSSPVKGVKKPPVNKRPAALTREQCAEILAAIADEEFRLFVEAMMESGARPSEVARVMATDVNLELGTWILQKHKTARKNPKPRVVYMTPRLSEITKRLMGKHPEGALFRGPRFGKPFGMHGICARFRRLREKLPHLSHAVAYAVRHGYATHALTKGVGLAQVAELLGHKDTSMVSQHYSHIGDPEQAPYMRVVAKKAVSS